MPTTNGLTDRHPLPRFLVEQAEEPEQWENAWDRSVIPSRIPKTSILIFVVTTIAIGVAVISVGNPVVLLANLTASLFDTSALQPDTGQSTPTTQSAAGTQDLLTTARDAPPINPGANPEAAPPSDGKTAATDAPTRNELVAAVKPADQSQAVAGQPSADELFKQFQAWAAEQDQRAQARTIRPAQDPPAQVVQNARRRVRPMLVHRQVRHVQNARAEIRAVQDPRNTVRREQNGRVPVPPVQDAQAQGQPVQNAQTPSFLQGFGWRN